MNLKFGEIDYSRSNNKINRLEYNICWVPITTIYKYFRNYDNIYFLLLSVFQLLTLGVFPKEWSPTGPFSTAIPLILCVALEIFTAMIKWITIWKKDNEENNKLFFRADKLQNIDDVRDPQHKFHFIYNKNIYPGHILYLSKDDIVPVDGILVSAINDNYGKINLALLTGESNMHYISKPEKDLILGDNIKISKNNFIPAGAIIKSQALYLWVTACGKEKVNKLTKSISKKKSRIDKFVGDYMMKISVKLLVLLVLIISLQKTWNHDELRITTFILYCFQNWILFNGIIPFSVKILLLLARTMEAYFCSYPTITINDSLQIDDFGKIKKIICDKTGTVTKNELEFTKFVVPTENKIIDLASYSSNCYHLSDTIYECLGLCIHQDGNDFSTIEDKIIRAGYQSLAAEYVEHDKKIILKFNGVEKKFRYIETNGLDFTFDRKMSSRIVKSINDEYFIYVKGSLDTIYEKLDQSTKNDLRNAENVICQEHPELRLLALAYRQLDLSEVNNLVKYDNHCTLENNLCFLGIIGIKDILQPGIKNTVKYLDNFGIGCSLCTGDRKITAVAVALEIGMTKKETLVDYCSITCPANIKSKTLVLSGDYVSNIDSDINLRDCLVECNNFIGYNMNPKNKRQIVSVIESQNIETLAIGDGFNDLGMFDTASISVAIKGNNFVENYTDFSIGQFSNLLDILNLSIGSYHKNAKLINFTFYRCSTVIFAIVAHCLMNYHKNYESPFNGFVLQAFNFAWTLFPIIWLILQKYQVPLNYRKHNYTIAKFLSLTSYKHTSYWNIAGILNGIIIVCLCYYYELNQIQYFNDVLALIIIFLLNIKMLFSSKIDIVMILVTALGVVNYLLYSVYMQNFDAIVSIILPKSFYYLLGIYAVIICCI